ncbi:RNA polymerase sigma factor [Fulvivirga ligni]|uniref:RNA polymerase sigma factor n=1 Tax=Fulvivirga ligni TaxID=2904246 RepID=UPI001F2E0FD9|nr:sigma-70 family RNA polymerase sigma factor [Fulvivirga ligni]UII19984.1 sigma-70 family RNA polymerase sigma factor [Fulvivirga ligni]
MEAADHKRDDAVNTRGDIHGFAQEKDSHIWDQFKSGNESAFIHIYNTHFKQLYHYGKQFTNDSGLIKDCIQDMFITIRKNRQNLASTHSIKLYLFKSIKRLILRSGKKYKRFHSDRELEEVYNFHFILSYEHHLIDQQLSEERRIKLQSELNQLPARQKEAIYYLFYENMSYAEICELMGFTDIKSGRNLVYKAFKTLRLKLSDI